MIELHPEIIEKDGKKQFVILPYEEFVAVEQALADVEDRNDVRVIKTSGQPRFVEEHLNEGFVLREVRQDALDQIGRAHV